MEFAEGFGVGEKTLGIRDLINNQEDSNVAMPDADLVQPAPPIMQQEQQQEPSSSSKKDDEASVAANTRTLSPKAVLRFIAPTMALWIAPPIMSLIDTSAVGRFCGPTELAGTCTVGSLVYIHHASCIVGSVFTQLNRHDSLFVPLSLSLKIAALSPGCTLIDSSSYLFFFIATAATNLVASAIANDDDPERIVSEALFLALCSGVALGGLVLVAGGPLLGLIAGEASASVVPSALKYATVRAFGQPFVIMASVARAAGKCFIAIVRQQTIKQIHKQKAGRN